MKKLNDVTMRRNGLRTRGRLMPFVFSSLLLALGSLLSAQSSEAKVTGNCSNCHTMHNSQNGQCQAKIYSGGSPVTTCTPQGFLLKGDCLGCHGQIPSGSQNIIPFGNIPQVLHSATSDLAGGNFKYLATNNNLGHNVIDTGYQEGNASMFPPPGDQFNQSGITAATFTCSGANGCHGDRTVTGELLAMKGAHHADDSVLKFGSINIGAQGGSTGLSYRFLKGVQGGEDSDWEATTSSTKHNEYMGATDRGLESTISGPGGGTISGLCAECHGHFHGPTNGDIANQNSSPWLRHPTDISLQNSGEYTGYTAYTTLTPVARTQVWNGWNAGGAANGTVTPGGTTDDIIMCLSCHRAHASPYFKMMRWDYKGWPASGGTNGCNVCHTSKN